MSAVRICFSADHWLQRLISWTPGQIDLIKTVALLFMMMDHANRILHLNCDWLMLAGRGAFPLFGLIWGRNFARHAVIRQSSLNVLWLWAVLSQMPYVAAGFPWWQGNILFTFAVSGQFMRWHEMNCISARSLAAVLVILWLPFSSSSYGLAGVVMLVSARQVFIATSAGRRLCWCVFWAVMVMVANAGISAGAYVISFILPVMVLTAISKLEVSMTRFWPKDFFVVFYSGHLIVLSLLAG